MSMRRILITAMSASSLSAGAAYAYVTVLSEKPPQRFNLIADVPRNDASVIPSKGELNRPFTTNLPLR